MAEVRGETLARRGKASHGPEGAMCEGQPTGEMSVGCQGRGKPVPQTSDFVFGREVEVVESNAGRGGGGASLGRAPMNKLSFGNRKG